MLSGWRTLTVQRRWQGRLDWVGRLGKGLDAAVSQEYGRSEVLSPSTCPAPPLHPLKLMPQSACSQASPPPFCSLHVLIRMALSCIPQLVGTLPSHP